MKLVTIAEPAALKPPMFAPVEVMLDAFNADTVEPVFAIVTSGATVNRPDGKDTATEPEDVLDPDPAAIANGVEVFRECVHEVPLKYQSRLYAAVESPTTRAA
jgi:hypothetical protein